MPYAVKLIYKSYYPISNKHTGVQRRIVIKIGVLRMKTFINKIFLAVVATVLVAGVALFTSCEKDGEKNNYAIQMNPKHESLLSYTGEKFDLNNEFVNEFNNYGVYHNELISIIDKNWDIYTNKELFDFAFSSTETITNINIDNSSLDLSQESFKSYILDELKDYEFENYIDIIAEIYTDYFNDEDLNLLIKDISDVSYGNYEVEEMFNKINIIEQKIFNSSISEEGKEIGMIFCAVYKYSLQNIQEILSNPSSNFYVPLCDRIYNSKESNEGYGDAVLADAAGAIKGARMGITAGVAGGPAGSALLGTVGAVCVGGISTAVEVGVKKKITEWIDSWF